VQERHGGRDAYFKELMMYFEDPAGSLENMTQRILSIRDSL